MKALKRLSWRLVYNQKHLLFQNITLQYQSIPTTMTLLNCNDHGYHLQIKCISSTEYKVLIQKIMSRTEKMYSLVLLQVKINEISWDWFSNWCFERVLWLPESFWKPALVKLYAMINIAITTPIYIASFRPGRLFSAVLKEITSDNGINGARIQNHLIT